VQNECFSLHFFRIYGFYIPFFHSLFPSFALHMAIIDYFGEKEENQMYKHNRSPIDRTARFCRL
jgi:hypothetical protein